MDFVRSYFSTGKSLWQALIFASTNPQYDKRLFIELQVQYMKITSSEHVALCPEGAENMPFGSQLPDLCFSNPNYIRNPKKGSKQWSYR